MSTDKTTADTICHICGIRLGDDGKSTCSAAHGERFWGKTTATDAAYRRGFEDGLAAAAAYIERIGSYGSEHQAANILLLEPEAESDAKQS